MAFQPCSRPSRSPTGTAGADRARASVARLRSRRSTVSRTAWRPHARRGCRALSAGRRCRFNPCAADPASEPGTSGDATSIGASASNSDAGDGRHCLSVRGDRPGKVDASRLLLKPRTPPVSMPPITMAGAGIGKFAESDRLESVWPRVTRQGGGPAWPIVDRFNRGIKKAYFLYSIRTSCLSMTQARALRKRRSTVSTSKRLRRYPTVTHQVLDCRAVAMNRMVRAIGLIGD